MTIKMVEMDETVSFGFLLCVGLYIRERYTSDRCSNIFIYESVTEHG